MCVCMCMDMDGYGWICVCFFSAALPVGLEPKSAAIKVISRNNPQVCVCVDVWRWMCGDGLVELDVDVWMCVDKVDENNADVNNDGGVDCNKFECE